MLRREIGAHGGLRALRRRPSQYRTSFPLEELDVHLAGGDVLRLMFKDLSRSGLSEAARHAKPELVHDPRREIEVYRRLLSAENIGAPRYFGSDLRPEIDRYWLFAERVEGRELYQVGELDVWRQVARWLAEFHLRFAARLGDLERLDWLVRYDADYFCRWLERARSFHAGDGAVVTDRLERLADRYDLAWEALRTVPLTLVHGEFYASNVLVVDAEDRLRVCPVDWEMAGIGPGLLDLAALTAGGWSERERSAMEQAYYLGLASTGERPLPYDAFRTALDACRLHVAVQWLGWSADWTPPAEHAQDWLAESFRLADILGV